MTDAAGPTELFAAAGEEGTAGLVVLATLVGGAVVWAANWWAQRRASRRKEEQEDEQTAITRLEALNARIDTERRELKAEINVLRDDCTKTKVTLARAVTWIRMLESMLERENIPHPTWTDIPSGDTDRHLALREPKK